MMRTTLDQDLKSLAKQQAKYCRVFSNPTRIHILWILNSSEMSVGMIAEAVGASIQNVSQHLRMMREQEILSARREAQTIYYKINQEAMKQQCAVFNRLELAKEEL